MKIKELIRAARERTGTTIISYLLDCDPRWRSLDDFGWTREEVAPHFEEYLANHPQAQEA